MHIPSTVTVITLARPLATLRPSNPEQGIEEAVSEQAANEHVAARADLAQRDEAFLEEKRTDTVQLALILRG